MHAVSRPQTSVQDASARRDAPGPAFRGTDAGLRSFLRSRVRHPPSGADPASDRRPVTTRPRPSTHGWSFTGDLRRAGTPSVPSARPSSEGETTEEPRPEMEGTTRIGEAEYPVDFVGPLPSGGVRAVPADLTGTPAPGTVRSASFHPSITVVTPGGRTSDCGGYTYKVRWGVPSSLSTAAGWIVQRVDKQFSAEDDAGSPVTPQAFDDTSNYPFWEAWEFTSGRDVWVGPSSGGSVHSGDTFSGSDYGEGTKGRKVVSGEVKGIVGFTPPSGMTVRNAAPAWALPYTRTAPAQFSATLPGAAHTLTAEWDCRPSAAARQPTTVTTNP